MFRFSRLTELGLALTAVFTLSCISDAYSQTGSVEDNCAPDTRILRVSEPGPHVITLSDDTNSALSDYSCYPPTNSTPADPADGTTGESRFTSPTSQTIDVQNPTLELVIFGSSADDAITVDALDSAFNANLTIYALGGNDRITVNAVTGSGTYTVIGGDGEDELIGPAAGAAWTVAGPSSGSVAGVAFSGIESLTGGAGADSFALAAGGGVSGVISGGAGEDTLTGPGTDAGWNVTAPNAGDVGGQAFADMENLTGAADNQDTFVFQGAGSLSGVVDGGDAGFDTLAVEGGTYAAVTYLATGPDSGVLDLDDSLITFSGMEPVTVDPVADDFIFALCPTPNLPDACPGSEPTSDADDIRVHYSEADGRMHIVSDTGIFEEIAFPAPANSLTVDAAGGDDTITIESLDPSFTGDLILIGGEGDDTFNSNVSYNKTYEFGDNWGDDSISDAGGEASLQFADFNGALTLRATDPEVEGTDSFGTQTVDYSGGATFVTDIAVPGTPEAIEELKDGLSALSDLGHQMDEIDKLGTPLFLLSDGSIGEYLDIGGILNELVAQPVEGLDADPTLDELIGALNQESGTPTDPEYTKVVAVGTLDAGVLTIDLDLDVKRTSHGIELGLGTQVEEFLVAEDVTSLTTTLQWQFSVGVDAGEFFANFGSDADVTADVSMNPAEFSARAGFLGLDVGSVNGNDSSLTMDVDMTVETSALGTVTLTDLQDASGSLIQRPTDPVDPDPALVDIDLYAEPQAGVNFAPPSPPSPPPAPPQVEVHFHDPDLFDASIEPTISESGFENAPIADFYKTDAEAVSAHLQQFATFLDIFGQSALNVPIPLTEGQTLADVFDLRAVFQQEFLYLIVPPNTADTLVRDLNDGEGIRTDGATTINGSVASASNPKTGIGELVATADLFGDENSLYGREVTVTPAGGGDDQTREIIGNTADTLTLEGEWTTLPAAGASFTIDGTDIMVQLSDGTSFPVDLEPATIAVTDLIAPPGTVDGPDIQVGLSDGTSFNVDLDQATTLGDLVQAIRDAVPDTVEAGDFEARVDPGPGTITLIDFTTDGGTLTVLDIGASTAASDLGLDVLADPQDVNGRPASVVQGSSLVTLGNIIQLIEEAAPGTLVDDRVFDVRIAGDGLMLVDITGPTTPIDGTVTAGVDPNDDDETDDNTLTGSASFGEVDSKKGYTVEITAGAGAGQRRKIASNTDTQLTVDYEWDTALDTTSEYKVVWASDVTAVNDSPARIDLGLTGSGRRQVVTSDTLLAEANGGLGVGTVPGNDIRVALGDGTTTFEVDLDAETPTTVRALKNAIDAAATAAGVTAEKFEVVVDEFTGSIYLVDYTAGGGSFEVENYGGSTAASDLRLDVASPEQPMDLDYDGEADGYAIKIGSPALFFAGGPLHGETASDHFLLGEASPHIHVAAALDASGISGSGLYGPLAVAVTGGHVTSPMSYDADLLPATLRALTEGLAEPQDLINAQAVAAPLDINFDLQPDPPIDGVSGDAANLELTLTDIFPIVGAVTVAVDVGDNTLTDANADFGADDSLVGREVAVTPAGGGDTQTREITGNTGTTLTVDPAWETSLEVGDAYGISEVIDPQFTNTNDVQELLVAVQDLTVEDLVAFLDQSADYLVDLETGDFEGQSDLAPRLPGLSRGTGPFIGFGQSFKGDQVGALGDAPPRSLQVVEEALEGLSSDDIQVQVALSFVPGTKDLRVGLDLTVTEFTAPQAFTLDLTKLGLDLEALGLTAAKLIADTGGASPLDVTAGGGIHVELGIGLNDPQVPDARLLDATNASFHLSADTSSLNFDALFGAMSVSIVNGSLTLDADGDPGTSDWATYTVDLNGDRDFADAFSETSITVAGAMNAALPLEFPEDVIPIPAPTEVPFIIVSIGDVSDPDGSGTQLCTNLGGAQCASPAGTTMTSNVNGPDWETADAVVDRGCLDKNLDAFRLGFPDLFTKLDDLLDVAVFGQPLPLVGTQLKEAADFSDQISRSVSDNLDQRSGILMPEDARQELFDALGPGGLDWLVDRNGDGKINTKDDIGIVGGCDEVTFTLDLEMPQQLLDTPVNVDLLLPGLGLESDALAQVKFGFSMPLVFGVSKTDGVFLDVTEENELEIDLEAALPAGEAVLRGNPQLTFAKNGPYTDTITRTEGSWILDGFEVGGIISVSGSTKNDGFYKIAAIDQDGLVLTLEDGGSVSQEGPVDGVTVHTVAAALRGSPTLWFEQGDAWGRIRRPTDEGSWIEDGFEEGQTITVAGIGVSGRSYNGTFTIIEIREDNYADLMVADLGSCNGCGDDVFGAIVQVPDGFRARMGVLPYRVWDATPGEPELSGAYTIDLLDGNDNDNRLTLSELDVPSIEAAEAAGSLTDLLTLSTIPTLTGAGIHVKLETDLPPGTEFPPYRMDLDITGWDFSVSDSLITDTTPTIEFNNVQFELVGFMRDFAGAALTRLDAAFEPLDVLVDFLTTEPVQVLSYFYGRTSYFSAAEAFGRAEVGDFVGASKMIRNMVNGGDPFDTGKQPLTRWLLESLNVLPSCSSCDVSPIDDLDGAAWMDIGEFAVLGTAAKEGSGTPDPIPTGTGGFAREFGKLFVEDGEWSPPPAGDNQSVVDQVATIGHLQDHPAQEAARDFLATQNLPGTAGFDTFYAGGYLTTFFGFAESSIEPMRFPILSDSDGEASNSFRLLLGNTRFRGNDPEESKLLEYGTPELRVSLYQDFPLSETPWDELPGGEIISAIICVATEFSYACPTPPTWTPFISITYEAGADFALGYDTTGLEIFGMTRNPDDIVNGLFFDDHEGAEPTPALAGTEGVLAGFAAPWAKDEAQARMLGGFGGGFLFELEYVGLKFSIEGQYLVGWEWNFNDPDGDGYVRADEFDRHNIDWDNGGDGIWFYDEGLRLEYRMVARGVLNPLGLLPILDFRFNILSYGVTIPVDPIEVATPDLATLEEKTGTLRLNIGDDAGDGEDAALPCVREQDNEIIFIGYDSDKEQIVVSKARHSCTVEWQLPLPVVTVVGHALDQHHQTFPAAGISKIVGDAGSGADRVIVSDEVLIPVELHGGGGNDYLQAGGGPGKLYGGGNDDTIRGSDVDDVIHGDSGDDLIFGFGGNDTIYGGEGYDSVDGGTGDDTIGGDDGDDVILGWLGDDTLYGGGGNDRIEGYHGADQIDGDDVILDSLGPATLYGSDRIEGDADADATEDDDDVILGGLGNDEIDGGPGKDAIYGDQNNDLIRGGDDNDEIRGGGASDEIYGGDGDDLIFSKQGSDFLNGEGDNDYYWVYFEGDRADNFITVLDSGGVHDTDVFTAVGTSYEDQFLLRANADGSVAFVAMLNEPHPDHPDDPTAVERVNYSGVERIVVNGGFGDDHFAVDDTAAEVTLNGEAGEDTFQIGQLFRSERNEVEANVSVDDVFATIETTRGFLSNGISAPMTVNGGIGADEFVVFHNLAVLSLNGDLGDDVFEVRAFALVGSQEPQRERTDITGGAGADLVQYAVNAPVNVDGGDGLDTLTVIGTEFGDDFVITEDGVYGGGLTINFVNIEFLRVDGAEGDDRFYVKSTSEKFVTELFGGLGADTFNGSGDAPPVVSNDLLGHSGIIVHDDVESVDPRFDGQKLFGVSANVADNDEPFAVIRESGGSTIITEGDAAADPTLIDSYEVVLTRQPDTDVFIKALAPIPTPDDRELRALAFRLSSETALWPEPDGSNLTLKFTPENWYQPQTVWVSADQETMQDVGWLFTRPELGDDRTFAFDDDAYEGVRFGVINHLVLAGSSEEVSGNLVAVTASPTITIPHPPNRKSDEFIGQTVTITEGKGKGQSRTITHAEREDDEIVLTLDRAWLVNDVPDESSTFTVDLTVTETGSVAGVADLTITIPNPNDRSSDEFIGQTITITDGPCQGLSRTINGAEDAGADVKLTLDHAWICTPPDTSSTFAVVFANGTETGNPSSVTNPTVTIPVPGTFTTDELLGRRVEIDSGPGAGQSCFIVGAEDVGADVKLTLDRGWMLTDPPEAGSGFQVRIDDAIVGTMTDFDETPDLSSDPDDDRSTFTDRRTAPSPFPTEGEGLTGAVLQIVGGPGAGQQRLILENDAQTLILNGPWRTDPAPYESLYRIERYDGLAIPSVQVQINDNDKAGLIVDETKGFENGDGIVDNSDIVDDFDTVTAVIEDGDGDHLGEKDVLRVKLSRQPSAAVDVSLSFDGAQLQMSLLDGTPIASLQFDDTNWSEFQPVIVEAPADGLREGFHSSLIEFAIDSVDADVTESQTDDFGVISSDDEVEYVGLSQQPIDGTVTVTLQGEYLAEGTTGGTTSQPVFEVLGNKIVFRADGDFTKVSGDIEVTYDYTDPGFKEAATRPVLARISDQDAPTVLVRESGGSTDVIEVHQPADPGGNPNEIPDDYNTNGSPWIDSYELVLTAPPSDKVTITAKPEQTKTTRTGGIRHDEIQVAISSSDPRAAANSDGTLTIEFNDQNWDEPVVIEVRAIDDDFVDGGDTKEFAPGPNTVSGILGPVIIDGAGGQGSLAGLGAPVILPGETNVKKKTGDVVSVSQTSVTVNTADLEAALDDLGLTDVSELVDKTIEVTATCPESNPDPDNPTHSAIGQFRLITGVAKGESETLTVLTINEPYMLQAGESEGDIVSYAITAESLNFFVNESDLVDYMFVHDKDSPADSEGYLTSTRLWGLNMGPDIGIGDRMRAGGITYGNLEALEINLGTGNNDFAVLGTLIREDGFQTWTFLNTGNDIEFGGRQGDGVVVKLNASEETPESGKVVSATQATIAEFASLTIETPSALANDELAGSLVVVEDGDGAQTRRRILSNVGNTLYIDGKWQSLPAGWDYQIINEADGDFAVNTQGGDDVVDASMSSLSIVAFGGVGTDVLTGGGGEDIIFGDQGRIDYIDEVGEIVTRLGDVRDNTFDDGAVLAATDNTLRVPDTVTLPTDDGGLQGLIINIISGKGAPQRRLITLNTASTILVDEDWDVGRIPDDTSRYRISVVPEDQTDGVVRDPRFVISRHRDVGGEDTISGRAGQDILIGGASSDTIDGESANDLIFGDNVRLEHDPGSGAAINPRFRALSDSEIYDDEGNPQIAGQRPSPDGTPWWADWVIAMDETAGFSSFGNDYIAGGAGDDTIFGQLGDDVVQGDGSIQGKLAGAPVGAYRDADGFLVIAASSEDPSDGDDYLEGNGGNDVVFGNLGQDDIVGGSSDLFSLDAPELRPDGTDLIFGGAGTDIARNDPGDATADSHSRDADVILGDNGNVFRLVDGSAGQYLNFNYDDYGAGRIIPRAPELLDYTPGGADYDPPNAANDIGAPDEMHGESGDDSIYGMKGDDVVFGEGQDDDIVAGYGHDWISGGTGEDGVIGDDGRIYTSRNGTAEPLYGIGDLARDLDKFISTPGKIQQATINVDGALKKTVNLTPFNLDPAGATDSIQDPLHDPAHADDIAFGGLGRDFLHGGAGDDAMSGAEALPMFYERPTNPGDILGYSRLRAGEFAAYSEYDPWRKVFVDENGEWVAEDGVQFLLNFDAGEGPDSGMGSTPYGNKTTDGDDVLFGDLGNDWLVGGTGRDNIYGGYGDDLLNADDDHDSTLGSDDPRANDIPDTHPSYEDRAYGGAGRDVLIANTGGDRLVDWTGEFNSYIVPFSEFGMAMVSRALQPQIAEFLYALSASDGADPTRSTDTGADPARNGEPEGELGVVRQQDTDWHDQTGAPADPQPGNIPGGRRDVLRSASFDGGSMSDFFPDSGVWDVSGGALQVTAESPRMDAAAVYHVGDALPSYFEVQAAIRVTKPTAGWKANAYIIFDYEGPTAFKFAGIDVSIDKLVMGHRDESGWVVDKQAPFQAKPDRFYNMLVAVNGLTASLVVDNATVFTHTYAARILDGYSYGLNWGLVGVGSDNSRGAFDNVAVQVLPPQVTYENLEDFEDGTADLFYGGVGAWTVSDGRLTGTPVAGNESAHDLIGLPGLDSLQLSSYLELSAVLNTDGRAGFAFDMYTPDDFKWIAVDASADQVLIGHHTARSGWVVDQMAARAIDTGVDYTIGLQLHGSTVNVTVDGQTTVSNAFHSVTVDGRFGLFTFDGTGSFDDVSVKTDDSAFTEPPR